MPKIAPTVLGIVLVAASIGFNTAHWPIVWQMVGGIMATPEREAASLPSPPVEIAAAPPKEWAAANESPEPLPPVAALPAAVPASVPESPPPAKIEVKPVPDAEKMTGDGLKPIAPDAVKPVVAGDLPPGAPVSSQKPLVPVPKVRIPTGSLTETVDRTLRRLPPVNQVEPSPSVSNYTPSSGAIPVYPSTGM